jgi:hypothetical protein
MPRTMLGCGIFGKGLVMGACQPTIDSPLVYQRGGWVGCTWIGGLIGDPF